MRVLIIKTSSLGDIIHTLPALTDAKAALKTIQFDWIIEENFAEIARFHPAVHTIFPIGLRRWRTQLLSKKTWQEIALFRKLIAAQEYNLVLDAQGLIKSGIIAKLCHGKRLGFDARSAREPAASFFYDDKIPVLKNQHAIYRLRELFSRALYYSHINLPLDYGLNPLHFKLKSPSPPYVVFLQGTTWQTKYWPQLYWVELAQKINAKGLLIKLPWGNNREKKAAEALAKTSHLIEVLPPLNLRGIAELLTSAKMVVGVDTGLVHLAAALNVPTLSLFGPTTPHLTGPLGFHSKSLQVNFPCAPCFKRTCKFKEYRGPLASPPCFQSLTPERVFAIVEAYI